MGGSATKPTQNSRNEITTNNMEIGLVNLSSEQWDLSRAHRIELFLIMFSIIILIIAIYKWRQKCRKKTCTKSNSLEMKDPEVQPSAPPTYQPQILPQPTSILIKHENLRQREPNNERINPHLLPGLRAKYINISMKNELEKANK